MGEITDLERYNLLIKLHETWQDTHMSLYSQLWNSVKFYITIISILYSVQTGYMIFFERNPALLIIPFGIIPILFYADFNAKKEYESIMQYITCLAKIEEELKPILQRGKKPEFFTDNNSIIYSDWLKKRKKYYCKEIKKLTDFNKDVDFVEYNLSRRDSAYGTIHKTLISIGIIDIVIVIITIIKIWTTIF